MPTYEHLCEACNKEFEQEYSIKANPPDTCPLCNTRGRIKRLISGGSGRGIVELSGNDLKAHLISEGQKLKNKAKINENVRANLEGESAYNNRQLSIDKLRRDFK